MRKAAPSVGGFTLIEIMAVVLLLGLMLSTVTANLNAVLPNSQSESAARQVLGDLDLARTSAISHGRSFVLSLDLGNSEYRLITPFDKNGRLARQPEDREALGLVALPKGIHFAGLLDPGSLEILQEGVHELVFNSTGSRLDIFLYLSNEAGEEYDLTIHLFGLTGQSEIMEGHAMPVKVSDADF
jgi:prepilin-type N-terminal cleavage/methylation domain-containing protein